jgi:hypothetical protein
MRRAFERSRRVLCTSASADGTAAAPTATGVKTPASVAYGRYLPNGEGDGRRCCSKQSRGSRRRQELPREGGRVRKRLERHQTTASPERGTADTCTWHIAQHSIAQHSIA